MKLIGCLLEYNNVDTSATLGLKGSMCYLCHNPDLFRSVMCITQLKTLSCLKQILTANAPPCSFLLIFFPSNSDN